ncbi:MAG TPA: quinone oxidoreductase [Bryobacteraceae bacterium]|nr:quinone oxidoreductase [Bryobacteraceae bacterium]
MKAVFIEQHGDASVLRYGDFAKPEPAAGQVLVKLAAAGVNFIDTYQRSGLYKIPLPAVLGMEGAGTVEALGEGVSGLRPGDPVAWAMSRGSYAEYAVVPAHFLVKVPAGLDLRQAAAAMLQGMTAHYLTHSTFPIEPGHTALVHAAAGGTGRLISQMIKLRGGRVIGTAGTREKAEVARAAGAADVILYREQDVVAEVKRLTDGKGVDVVYDGVGDATFMQSIDCLKPRGMMALFGQSSGPVKPVDPSLLQNKGSLFLTRPTLGNYASPDEIKWRSSDVLGWILNKKLDLLIERVYPLADAAQAHTDLESRKTMGKLVLTI